MPQPDEIGRQDETYWAVAMVRDDGYRLACGNDSAVALFWKRSKAQQFRDELQTEFDETAKRLGRPMNAVRCRVVRVRCQITAYPSEAARQRARQ